MNHARLAAMTAIALGLTLQAPLVGAGEATAAQSPSDTQSQSDTARTRHPPTAQMDEATPRQKSPDETARSMKHPPTAEMDRAVPDERSPGANDENRSPGTNDKQSPGATYDDNPQDAAPDQPLQRRNADGGIRI